MEWLTGWNYRKKIGIKGVGGAGTGYQILLKVGESSNASGYDFHLEGHAEKFPIGKNDSGDIRFVSSDQKSLFPIWVEKVEGTAPNRTAYVWIKILDSLDNDVDIYCYYGNANADNVSNGDDVFEFFDDFDRDIVKSVFNTYSKWYSYDAWCSNQSTYNYPFQQNGCLYVRTDGGAGGLRIASKNPINVSKACIVARVYSFHPGWNPMIRIGFSDRTPIRRNGYCDTDASLKYKDINVSSNTWNIVNYVGQDLQGWYPFVANWDNELHYDWVIVRTYIDPEPAFHYVSSEQIPPTIVFGVACDKYGRPIIGKEVKIFVFDKDNGKLLGQTLTDHYGKWECQVPVSSGTKVVTLLILEGEYYGDVDIVGAGFHVTQEMES